MAGEPRLCLPQSPPVPRGPAACQSQLLLRAGAAGGRCWMRILAPAAGSGLCQALFCLGLCTQRRAGSRAGDAGAASPELRSSPVWVQTASVISPSYNQGKVERNSNPSPCAP